MEKKTKEVLRLYCDKAQDVDRKYCNTDPEHVGPLQQHLDNYGQILCLVARQYGDVSQDLHTLLKNLVTSKHVHRSN